MEGKIKVVLRCEKCNTIYELDVLLKDAPKILTRKIELEEEIDLEERRLTISDLPPTIPKAFKPFLEEKIPFFIPIFYKRVMERKPVKGNEISVKFFSTLGISEDIAKELVDYFAEKGIKALYKFQEIAIQEGLQGKHIVIVAPTGTGKTEAFTLPAFITVVKYIKNGWKLRPLVLIIYPTKALARDQLQKLFDYAAIFKLRIDILDGDTPNKVRKRIMRDPPEILLTNFDMIHFHMGKRTPLGALFPRARIVIIDELHEYTGAFGTNIHYIIKRLKRMGAGYGKIQFIMSSATISNPGEFASKLIGDKVKVITETGRKTPLHILLAYCTDQIQYALARIILKTIEQKIKTLVFLNTRRSAELTFHILRKLARKYQDIVNKFELHRAGLPKKIRESIEIAFKRGEKNVLISTPTLELGIDIGDIDLVISEITPINRFIQRSGRAGRREEPGAAILALRSDDPISDYYAVNPRDYFEDVSLNYIEPMNRYIAERHTYISAYERPIDEEEVQSLQFDKSVIKDLLKAGALFKLGNKYYANGTVFSKYFMTNIRGSDKIVKVIFNGKIIDEREAIIALRELYPGAIYLNRGVKYVVKSLNLSNLIAEVERAPREYIDLYTRPIYTSGAKPVEGMIWRDTLGTRIFFGNLQMRATVEGYVVFQEGSKKPIAEYELEQPIRYQYETYGVVFKALPVRHSDTELVAGTYHALEHILIEGTNAITGGGSEDLGGIAYGTTGVIVIYDGSPGGNGVSRLLFERFEKAVEKAYKILMSCRCREDVPCNKCVYSYRCGNNNRPLNQIGAQDILRRMIKREKVEDADKALEILEIMEKGIV